MKVRRRIVLCIVCGLGIVASSLFLFPESPTDEEIGRALSTTIVERLNLSDAPAGDAVEIILQAYREQHPEMPELRVVSHRLETAEGESLDPLTYLTVTMDLRGIPADTALEYVSYC